MLQLTSSNSLHAQATFCCVIIVLWSHGLASSTCPSSSHCVLTAKHSPLSGHFCYDANCIIPLPILTEQLHRTIKYAEHNYLYASIPLHGQIKVSHCGISKILLGV